MRQAKKEVAFGEEKSHLRLYAEDSPSSASIYGSASKFFVDGRRKIDYILAFEISNDKDESRRAARRREFERNLTKKGLHLEPAKFDQKTSCKIAYVKVHAPWDVLAFQAEFLKLKMPIKKNDMAPRSKVSGFFDRICSNIKCLKVPTDDDSESDYYSAVFSRKMQEQFIIESKDSFFKDSERSRMVWDILIRTSYDSNYPDRVGITKLIKHKVYSSAYPLHDAFSVEVRNFFVHCNGKRVVKPTARQKLYECWAKPSAFCKLQPLDRIRNYFGEKIAIYFAWLGFYTKTLFPAAICGIICVVYGGLSLEKDVPSQDICNATGVGSIEMCPSCELDCRTWNLSQSCYYSRVTHIFDNWSTVIFAVCMSIWATLFLEGWKRYMASLAWDWDLTDFIVEDEAVRPEFEMEIKTKEKNPITELWEPYMPFSQRLCRMVGSSIAVVFCLCLVIVFVFGVIVYRVIVEYMLKKEADLFIRSQAPLITAFTGAFLNLICIMILDRIYQILAWKLTAWECPRTESQFEDSYTFKVFMFQFINFNSSLFYIAFFKGKFLTVPNDRTKYLFGYPQEACDPAGCMVELLIQLGVIMVGKQFVNNCVEILFPIISNKWRRFMSGDSASSPRWEQDFKLTAAPPLHLFDEFLEMVLQYGFITLFVAAFPLAPLFALINNIMEIRLDAYKFVVAYRRPMPARARDIGAWYGILDGISKLAVLCNACVIAFTSDFVPRLVYQIVYSADQSLNGYVESKLAFYDPAPWCSTNRNSAVHSGFCNVSYCRFMDYRNPPCNLSAQFPHISDSPYFSTCPCGTNSDYTLCIKWWHILAAKLAFVLVFEHVVFMIKGAVAYFIPDIPRKIMVQIQRENYLAKQAFYQHELLSKSCPIVATEMDPILAEKLSDENLHTSATTSV